MNGICACVCATMRCAAGGARPPRERQPDTRSTSGMGAEKPQLPARVTQTPAPTAGAITLSAAHDQTIARHVRVIRTQSNGAARDENEKRARRRRKNSTMRMLGAKGLSAL